MRKWIKCVWDFNESSYDEEIEEKFVSDLISRQRIIQ